MAKFNIEAHLHRFEGKNTKRSLFWIRQYARIETAVRRCTEYLILEGEVGDLIEFVLKKNSYQVGTVHLRATGRMEVLWNDDEAHRLKNEQLKALNSNSRKR